MSRRALAFAAGLGVSGCLLVVATVPVSAAQSRTSFTAVAEADGLHVTVHVPGGPLDDDVLDGGAPRAQALLDSLGTSTAFAAAPWPGELIANAPGLLSGLTGQTLPQYPAIASTSYPTDAQDSKTFGSVALTARSAEQTSSSRGYDATPGAGTLDTTAAVARLADETLTAKADTLAEQLAVGPLLLGHVEAHVMVSRRLDGALTRKTSLVVTGTRIGGQAVELTPDGFAVAGTKVPVGPDNPALKPLVDQGITVRWARPTATKDGAVSPAVVITVTRPFSLAGGGTSTVTYTVGRTAARITTGELTTAGPVSPTTGGVSVPKRSERVFAPPAALSLPLPLPLAEVRPATRLPTTQEGTAPRVGPLLGLRRAEIWPTFYIPLVVAGLLTLGGMLALRAWGVRRVWAS